LIPKRSESEKIEAREAEPVLNPIIFGILADFF